MTRRQTSQSGSVFTILMAGIAIAAALGVVLYQTISGPMSSMVRITNKTQAKAQMQSIASIIIMDAVNNMPNNGDCSGTGVGMVVPRSWKPGTGPTGGGILPTTIGAPLTDPWGTNYGYCTWEVGGASLAAGCQSTNGYDQTCTGVSSTNTCTGGSGGTSCTGGNYNGCRLLGSINPTVGSASSQIVFAIISAGPNRTFNSTCSAYVNTSSTLVTPGGDDIVISYTYQQASTATSSLWTLSPSSAATAVISKDISVGTTLGTVPAAVSSTYSNGIINGAAVVAQGEITSTAGAIGLANVAGSSTQLSSGNCNAGSLGQMYYNTTTNIVDVCTCTGGSCPATGTYSWTPLATGSSSSVALNAITAATADGTLQDSVAHPIIWNWSGLVTGTALTLADTDASATTATTLAVTSLATTGAAGYFTNTGGGYALITGSGNVGIGTTSPGQLLEISKNQILPTLISVLNSNNGSVAGTGIGLGNNSGALQGEIFLNSSGNATYGGANSLNISNSLAAPIAFFTSNTERMRIDSSGKVGIGTVAPVAPLTVGASLLATSDFSTTTPQQAEINDLDTATGGARSATVLLMQANSASNNTAGVTTGLLIDNLIPSGQTVNFKNRIGINAETNDLGSGADATLTGGQFTGSFGGSTSAVSTIGTLATGQNTSTTGTVTSNIGVQALATNFSTGSVTSDYGVLAKAQNLSTGTITSAVGVEAAAINSSTGTITNAYGGYFTVTNSGTITNAYGLLISTVTGTNAYGIYDASGDPDYFSGEVGVGVNPYPGNGAKLQVTDTTLGTGLYVSESTATGTAYGINTQAVGAATTNVGGYFAAQGATSNYGIEIPNLSPPAGANNYAIYSVSNAQSYIQGSLGVSTLPLTGARGLSVGFAAGAPSTTAANAGLVLSGSTTESLLVGADPSGLGEMWIQAGVLSNVAGALALNPVGGNVGIGTASPGAPLEVRTTSAGYASNAGGLALTTAGSTNGLRFGVLDSSYSWISSFNSLPLVLNAGGNNVGIGTTSPLVNLDIAPAPSSNVGGVLYIRDNTGVNGTFKIANYNGANYVESGLSTSAASEAPLYFTNMGASSTWVTISSTGNVGIGVTTPGQPLDVRSVQGSGNLQLRLGVTSGNYYDIGRRDADGYLSIQGNQGCCDSILLAPTSGNVGIGTTSPAANGLTINNGSTPTLTLMVNGTSNEQIYDDGTALYVMSVSGGNGSKLTHGATLWTSSSDRRLKKDIQPLPDAYGLDAVLRMKPVTFNWRNPKAPQTQQIGFIAQDMQQAIPEVVTRTAPTAYAPDGELGIEYAALVVPLVKSVQELKTDNDNDRKQFAALKAANDNEAAQIKALTARLDALEAAHH
jgi:hypothetical protein